jgi:hypothetical protein
MDLWVLLGGVEFVRTMRYDDEGVVYEDKPAARLVAVCHNQKEHNTNLS